MKTRVMLVTSLSLMFGAGPGLSPVLPEGFPVRPGRALAAESPNLYGIHDHDPSPREYLDHISSGGARGWVTATVAIGADPNNTSGDDFSWIEDLGHTVIVRLNYGYCPDGTIPPADRYDDFARRAANYVAASRGAHIWLIGNETNLPVEWPVVDGRLRYVSPQEYATVFRKVYDAIKAVRPDDKVITQAIAPFAGPYGEGSACGYPHDGNPLNWVQYLNQTLTAVSASGGLDGIALHINSRGYTYDDIHSEAKVDAGGQALYFSFYVYKDWVDYGIPSSLYHLPLYATECNGLYYWSGGHPENPDAHYEAGWMQEIYAEIDRYNQEAAVSGKPIFRCVNMYRWCAWCDGWNIDGSPYEDQILADLDGVVTAGYTWPGNNGTPAEPTGENLALAAADWAASSVYNSSSTGDKAYDGIVSESSKWTSDGTTAESWLAIDLGLECTITGFIVRHAGAAGEPAYFNTQAFRIETGTALEGAAWQTRATVDNSAQANISTVVLDNPVSARYVRLHVTDAGIDQYARIPEFEVYGYPGEGNQPPVAVASASPETGQAPLTVRFSGTASHDDDGSITGYALDFADGTTGSGATVTHTYASEGVYIVTLTVTDDDGETDTTSVTVTVEAEVPGCGGEAVRRLP